MNRLGRASLAVLVAGGALAAAVPSAFAGEARGYNPAEGGNITISLAGISNACMSERSDHTVSVQTCLGSSNANRKSQVWRVVPMSSGTYALMNAQSGWYLTMASNGAVSTIDADPSEHDVWKFVGDNGAGQRKGQYEIQDLYTDKWLGLSGSTVAGANSQYNGGELWQLEAA
ncbi:RICIN domain-containing protein [Streptomyces vinaceus]